MPKSALALLLCAAGAWAAGPWTSEDLWNRHTPADPRISPDGQQVVYLDRWNSRTANAACANLWLVSTRDRQRRRLTDGPWADRAPRWSPDNTRIAYISGRGGIHVLALNSGSELSIESNPLALAWSADGQSIAFTAMVQGTPTPPAWAPAAILTWLAPHVDRRVALFVVSSAGGPPQQLPAAEFDAAGEPAWMPDGKSILVASAEGVIYSLHLADRTARAIVTESGRAENPLPSPNGAKIAWLATEAQPHSYSIRKLYVMNADGSRLKELANGLDRDPALPQWSSDSRTIYFLADDAGATHIYASRADSTLRQVTKGAERLSGFSVADNGHAVTVRRTSGPAEVVSFTVDLPPVPIVLAAPELDARDTGAVEEIHFPSGSYNIQGWLVKPPRFDPALKYPLLLDVADAPRRMHGPEFDLRSQILAARGWLVLRVNPRGTPGYGEHFGRLLPTRYPGDDADDLLAAVDFVIGKGSVDTRRVAIGGGLLTAWMLGHTDRFTVAIARHPIVDFALYAAAGTDNARRAMSWMGAMPWDDPEQYLHHSPVYFAQNWKTPTLVLAGAADPQAEDFYAVLQQRHVASSMVRLPDDKPATRIAEMDAILAWLEKSR